MQRATINTLIGKVTIHTTSEKISKIEFSTDNVPLLAPKTALLKLAAEQLDAYFSDPNFQFTLPVVLNVTAFQENVLHALQKIKVGKTKSYGELATELKSGARAIGNACRRNPLPLIIPCHRIIASDGKLGGFAGDTQGHLINVKRLLLEHEGARK